MNPGQNITAVTRTIALRRVANAVRSGEFKSSQDALQALRECPFLELPANVRPRSAKGGNNPSAEKPRSLAEVKASSPANALVSIHSAPIQPHP